jgi:TonB-dependent starch-binding outer membrane protein SusC
MWKTRRGTSRLLGAALLTTAACGRSPQPSPTPASPAARDSVEVGYGAQPKEKSTGAVTALSSQDVNRRPLRIEEFLRGKVAGLQITRGPNGPVFRIRNTGASASANDPEEALVVLDGVPIPSQGLGAALAGLSPEDIKQVSVLKDVASTSVYGMRGSGGVILIVTKQR